VAELGDSNKGTQVIKVHGSPVGASGEQETGDYTAPHHLLSDRTLEALRDRGGKRIVIIDTIAVQP
jgi:hypothetical protein